MQEMVEFLDECLTRACMYLTKGYIDKTEKDDYSVMEWEAFIKAEVMNDCKGIPITSEED